VARLSSSVVFSAKALTPCGTPAVARFAGPGRYHQHADAICTASWTAPFSYLTGGVARWKLAGLRDHAVRLMKRRGRHGLGGSCDGQNKSNSDQPEHRFLRCEPEYTKQKETGRAALALPVCTPLTVSESGGRKPSPFLPEPIAAVGVGNDSEKV
jgi:hypothetical protein